MTNTKLNTYLQYLGFALVAYMPFHVFLSRWLSLYTGGLMVWEMGKDFVTIAALSISLYIIIRDKLWKNSYIAVLLALSVTYAFMHLVFLLSPALDRHAIVTATLYNGRLFAYLFIGITIGSTSDTEQLKRLQKLLIIVSTITVVFALFQYLLPKDLLSHFGYSIERGARPNFFIDDKPQFPRVMATLRDPNSYGAYLILPITMLWLIFLKNIKRNKYKVLLGLLILHIVAILLTFSRSSIIGLSISLLISTTATYSRQLKYYSRKYVHLILIALIFLVISGIAMRNSSIVQNVVFHSDQTTIEADPNEKRIAVQQQAVSDIIKNPVGHSPGSAGQVAFGNRKLPGIITENYYLQIAYEIGVLGFVIFLLILIITYLLLVKSKKSTIRTVLIGSFWGYVFIALLTHLWSNEAVSVQWWLTAGMVIGYSLTLFKADTASTTKVST